MRLRLPQPVAPAYEVRPAHRGERSGYQAVVMLPEGPVVCGHVHTRRDLANKCGRKAVDARHTVAMGQYWNARRARADRISGFVFRYGGIAAAVLAAGWVGNQLRHADFSDTSTRPQPPAVVATSEPPLDALPLVTFTWTGTTCADGWPSQSIGKRGACSHHGGVVSVFSGSDGTTVACGRGHPSDTQVEQAADRRLIGRIGCERGL